MYTDQAEATVRFGWGEQSVRALSPHSDITIIVDVLSFSTAVDVAVSRGAVILPFNKRGGSAADFAQAHNAHLAGFDRHYSLRPTSLQTIPWGTRLVLPSPNGSALTLLADSAAIIAGCLRNYRAIARWINAHGGSTAVIAAGERWSYDRERSSDNLRPSFEDLIGAGAIISQLSGPRSPEAEAALAVFQQLQDRVTDLLPACASGRELIEKGRGADVTVAADLGASTAVPLLQAGAYVNQEGI